VATIRRDLQYLDKHGLLNRVHGGATPSPVVAFGPRSQAYVEEKARIARVAADLLCPGDTVAFETGTTVLAVMQNVQVAGLSIVTNSVDVVLAAQGRNDARLVVTGGTFDPYSHAMYGALTEQFYAEHQVDKLVIGAGSVNSDGLRDSNIDALAAKRAAIAAAHQVVLVADSSKFGLTALALVCDWSPIGTLVTDTGAPADVLDSIRDAGTTVIVV
jgi:DeoR/GlpR family transcriptional regulator of sugar metabolism